MRGNHHHAGAGVKFLQGYGERGRATVFSDRLSILAGVAFDRAGNLGKSRAGRKQQAKRCHGTLERVVQLRNRHHYSHNLAGGSEEDFAGKLNFARIGCGARALAECAWSRNAGVRILEAWVIECIEKLSAKFEAATLAPKGEALEQADIG